MIPVTATVLPAEQEALSRLSFVQGYEELSAVILALVMAESAMPVWSTETAGLPGAKALLDNVSHLGNAARLPCLEAMLSRMRLRPKPERRALLRATRRVIAAHKPLRPLDRLHWLAMRRRLGDPPPASLPQSQKDFAQLPSEFVPHVASVTAYLSRMVPGLDAAAGQSWYAQALSRLVPRDVIPPCRPPDGEGFVHALQEVECLPWMTRPVIVRAWIAAAIAVPSLARLPAGAADAIRLAAGLLDSPLPPELARHYIELQWIC